MMCECFNLGWALIYARHPSTLSVRFHKLGFFVLHNDPRTQTTGRCTPYPKFGTCPYPEPVSLRRAHILYPEFAGHVCNAPYREFWFPSRLVKVTSLSVVGGIMDGFPPVPSHPRLCREKDTGTMRACLAAIFVLFLWSKPLWALLYSSSSFAFTPPRSRTTFSTSQLNASASGLYRPFSEHALTRLEQSGLFIPSNDIIPAHLQRKEVPAKGNMPPGTMVRIETRALTSRHKDVAYARCALLETLLPSDEEVV